MNTEEFNKYLSVTYDWARNENISFVDVIHEITTAGFTNEEIGAVIKEICGNETFRPNESFKSSHIPDSIKFEEKYFNMGNMGGEGETTINLFNSVQAYFYDEAGAFVWTAIKTEGSGVVARKERR